MQETSEIASSSSAFGASFAATFDESARGHSCAGIFRSLVVGCYVRGNEKNVRWGVGHM